MQLSNKPVTPCVFSHVGFAVYLYHSLSDLNDLFKFKFKNGEAR